MANIKIAVINACTVLSDDEVQKAVRALQKQVHRDFAPVWGIDADLKFIPQGGNPPEKAWWLVIFDDSDQAGALGYHDLTTEGMPLGKVFARTDLEFGDEWTVTASHELLEMLGDPDINLTAFVQTAEIRGRLYAYEVCDACEADMYAYKIDGVSVSDFVYPAWFEAFRARGSTQFDHQRCLSAPFELLPGGYIGIFDIYGGTGWTQLTAKGQRHEYKARPRVGSRRERRRTVRSDWLNSKVKKNTRAPRKGIMV